MTEARSIWNLVSVMDQEARVIGTEEQREFDEDLGQI